MIKKISFIGSSLYPLISNKSPVIHKEIGDIIFTIIKGIFDFRLSSWKSFNCWMLIYSYTGWQTWSGRRSGQPRQQIAQQPSPSS